MPDSQSPLQDAESFSSLFTRTHLVIFRFIYGLHGGPQEEVEDITSETYSKAWKGRSQFYGDDQEALSWLFTIARNLVIDTYRKNKNPIRNTINDLDESVINSTLLSPEISLEQQISGKEQLIHLWELLQALPVDRREMIILRYMLGWQVKQIAILLKMEENTVSVYIRRSLDQIRQNW